MDCKNWQDRDWIAKGLRYSTVAAIPVVQRQRKLLLQIPAEFDDRTPHSNLSIQDLGGCLENTTQGTVIAPAGKHLFSADDPNTGLEGLFNACVIPPKATLDEMQREFGQLWLDGQAQSIIDWTDRATRYPVAALTIYWELARASAVFAEWKRVVSWMEWKATPDLIPVIRATKQLMFAFEWDSDLRAVETRIPTKDIFGMLGRNKWLTCSHVDALMQVVADRYERKHGICDMIFAPCIIVQLLELCYKSRNSHRHGASMLDRYREQFRNGDKRCLYFVANVNGNHWVAWKVDFEARTFGYADSLNLDENYMKPLKLQLSWWISEINKDKRQFAYQHRVMERGDQAGDTESCGIIAYNAILHDLFGGELWTLQNRKRLRIEAFNEIVKQHNYWKSSTKLGVSSDNPIIEALEPNSTPTNQTSIPPCVHPRDEPVISSVLKIPQKRESDRLLAVKPVLLQYQGTLANLPNALQTSVDRSSTLVMGCPSKADLQAFDMIDDVSGNDVGTCNGNTPVLAPGDTPPGPASPLPSTTRDASSSSGQAEESLQELKTKNTDTAAACKVPAKRPSDATKDGNQPAKLPRLFKKGNLDTLWQANKDSSYQESGNEDDESSSGESVDDDGGEKHGGNTKLTRVLGQSRSAVASRKQRDAQLTGTFIINNSYFHNFKNDVLKIDKNANFRPAEWRVQHSRCQKWVKMKSAYSVVYFADHVKRCPAEHTKTLFDFLPVISRDKASSELWHQEPRPEPCETHACIGITSSLESSVESYLNRLTARGGGGKSTKLLSLERFGKPYRELNKKQKKEVELLNESSWRWVIKHEHRAVFSVACLNTICVPGCKHGEDISSQTCAECISVLHSKDFRRTLRVPEPTTSNGKFVNKKYHQEEQAIKFLKIKGIDKLLHPENSVTRLAVRYAKLVANGAFAGKHKTVFSGLVHVELQDLDRRARGKKPTNFAYPPEFMEFAQTLALRSPQAYRLISQQFRLPMLRTLAKKRAKEHQFTPGISPRSFELADEFVSKLDIPHRFVALSADDTKLMPTLCPFLERESGEWYILGGIGEPLLVNDPDNLRKELEQANIQKATKVRVWTLTVPLPKIPPIVLAAIAIGDDVSAATLTGYTNEILTGLRNKDIWVMSYACDGTEKERVNQRNLRVQAHSTDTQCIAAPAEDVDPLLIPISLQRDGRPMALVQDSCHGRKTYRNNIMSGAKTMVLGNYCAMYKHLREMANSTDSPLYKRDVEKSDKQDDRAAARVFSSAALAWLIRNRSDERGIIMYLFVFGELIDAYQNRWIPHSQRIRMVLRAQYFIEMWEKFIHVAQYTTARSSLSREALDITNFLVKGYLELFYIYRDYIRGTRAPFLPWLHSSETCEHIFAECRKEVKDFDFATFCHLMPKVHCLVRYSMNLGVDDAKARAQGYAHTWPDIDGISLSNLASFPTDAEIRNLANSAYNDAVDLWLQLGVHRGDLHSIARQSNELEEPDSDDDEGTEDEQPIIGHKTDGLPSIISWYPDLEAATRLAANCPSDDDNSFIPSIEDSERTVLEQLLTQDETRNASGPIGSEALEKTMFSVSCAKLLLDFDTLRRVEDIPLPTKEEYRVFLDEYRTAVGKTLADSLPSLVDHGPGLRTLDDDDIQLSPEQLVAFRHDHETNFARKAIRTPGSTVLSDLADTSQLEKDDLRARTSLIKKISEALKEQQDSGISSGLGRKVRWTTQEMTGNTANAVAAAETRAMQALSRRSAIYTKNTKIPPFLSVRLSRAGIHDTSRLHEGSHGVVFISDRLLICHVLSVYSKGGGSQGKHSWVEGVISTGDISYISVQTYEQSRGRVFKAIHSSISRLRVNSFAHIPGFEFLSILPDPSLARKGEDSIELTAASFAIWREIERVRHLLSDVMKQFRKRK